MKKSELRQLIRETLNQVNENEYYGEIQEPLDLYDKLDEVLTDSMMLFSMGTSEEDFDSADNTQKDKIQDIMDQALIYLHKSKISFDQVIRLIGKDYQK
jgi:hypothetical protein